MRQVTARDDHDRCHAAPERWRDGRRESAFSSELEKPEELDPDDDPSYQEFLATAAGCRSCPTCTARPCPGCAAGGLCDQMCWCDDDGYLEAEDALGDDLGGDP